MLLRAASILANRPVPNMHGLATPAQFTAFSRNIAVALKYPKIGPAIWENPDIVYDIHLYEIVRHFAAEMKAGDKLRKDISALGSALAWHQAVCTAYLWPINPRVCIYRLDHRILDSDADPVVWDGSVECRICANELHALHKIVFELSTKYSDMNGERATRSVLKQRWHAYSLEVLYAAGKIAFASEVNRLAGQ